MLYYHTLIRECGAFDWSMSISTSRQPRTLEAYSDGPVKNRIKYINKLVYKCSFIYMNVCVNIGSEF